MTIKGFQTSLEKLGVEEISVEEGFDPNMHCSNAYSRWEP